MVSRGKTEISALLPPSWKKCLGYPWKNPLLSPLEKKPSDTDELNHYGTEALFNKHE